MKFSEQYLEMARIQYLKCVMNLEGMLFLENRCSRIYKRGNYVRKRKHLSALRDENHNCRYYLAHKRKPGKNSHFTLDFRFYVERRSKFIMMIQRAVEILKTKPGYCAPYTAVKEEMGMPETSCRKLFKSTEFQRYANDRSVCKNIFYVNVLLNG